MARTVLARAADSSAAEIQRPESGRPGITH
jgi:hypothetical protein